MIGNRYLLDDVLGSGGAAVVHRATDTRLDRPVAVKLVRDAVADPTQRERFVSEARLLGGLSHPHLVRVLDAGVDDGRPYLVLELVEGRTLAEEMAHLAPDRVARIGAEVAAALAQAHAAGIVHRDVKPGNVLIAADGSAKLGDFGIARLVDDTVHHTRTGMVVGTVAYLAPEQVSGDQVTTAADVYSWGLVLLEALTGVRAYAGSSVEAALARLSRQPEVPASLPDRWRRLLLAMTAREPGDRPTASEVVDQLRVLSGTAPAATVAVPRALPEPPAHAVPSRATLLAGLAAVLLLGGGVTAWSAWPGDRTDVASKSLSELSADSVVPTTTPTPRPATAVPQAADPAPRTGQPRQVQKHHHKAKHHKAKHSGNAKHPGKGHKGHGPKKHH
jgi:serine/threonine protein kinase